MQSDPEHRSTVRTFFRETVLSGAEDTDLYVIRKMSTENLSRTSFSNVVLLKRTTFENRKPLKNLLKTSFTLSNFKVSDVSKYGISVKEVSDRRRRMVVATRHSHSQNQIDDFSKAESVKLSAENVACIA